MLMNFEGRDFLLAQRLLASQIRLCAMALRLPLGTDVMKEGEWLSHEGCLFFLLLLIVVDRLCGLVVRVLGYRSGSTGSIPGTTRKKSSESGTGSTQPRECN
jgi:hypothetical protein